MATPVLHMMGSYDDLDTFVLMDASLGQGQALTIHLTRPDERLVEIFHYREVNGKTEVRTTTADVFSCGCP